MAASQAFAEELRVAGWREEEEQRRIPQPHQALLQVGQSGEEPGSGCPRPQLRPQLRCPELLHQRGALLPQGGSEEPGSRAKVQVEAPVSQAANQNSEELWLRLKSSTGSLQ